MRARIFAPFLAPGQPKPCRNRAAAMLLRPLVPPNPKGCLPSPMRGLQRSPRLRDIYRAAIQRSGRSWKAIAGKAVSRPKVSKNDSSSSSAPLMPTSEEWTRDHSPSMKAHASPGSQRAGMPSQSANLGSILTIWGSGRQNAPRPARQGDGWPDREFGRGVSLPDPRHIGAPLRIDGGWRGLPASGDRDAFQLASDRTTILYPVRAGEIARIGPAEVRARYGVDPKQVPDLIALRGDSSDKLPGAPGVGPAGAAALLKRYGSLEAALTAGRFPAILERLRLFQSIATMDRRAPLPSLRSQKPTWHKAAALAREWELNQLAGRLEELASTEPTAKHLNR